MGEMRRNVWTAMLVALALPATLTAQERFTLSGSDVAIWNLAGEIVVEAGSGSEVEVEVVRGGEDGDALRVETGRVADWETLRVIFPDDRVVYRDGRGNTTMRVSGDGTFGSIRSGRGERVRIRSRGSGLEAHADLRIRVPRGRTIAVFLGVGQITASNIEGDVLLDGAAASIEADGLRGTINLDTGSGHVRLRDAEGDIRLDTGSGRVEASAVRGTRLDVDTGSGGVELDDIDVAELAVDTGSGRIEARRVSAPDITMDTGSGGVSLELLSDIESLVVDTGSGGVTIDAPADLGARVDIETGSGGIDVDLPVRVRSTSRSRLVGEIGDGEGSIRIETGSGGVRIRSH